ncbi:hypothetical protein HGG82_08020 [Marinomonas sp. M1K-6]|uniref:Uncharacterized protein n=1 Tax=Marinomonas profundi TaxID=2726122 RepID=A0A847R9E6_9GAMM|nr:hypothetical protein [Marinomonas profundi]NLQ17574.1 hypothetical protein [Marinomonas profundi]UDV02209.1 hypothetical protein J8N69_11460 [Marinomonas profundi]
MINKLETTLEHAQKITLGQVDNGTLATAVNCADTLQIVRHGIVESYVVPKHLIDDLLLKVSVLECDNKRLLGERVAESITVPKSHFFNHDFKIDWDAVRALNAKSVKADFEAQYRQSFELPRERVTNPNCPYCTNPNCDAVHCLYDNLSQAITAKHL